MATFVGTGINNFQENGFNRLFGNGGNDHLVSDQPGVDLIRGGTGLDYLFFWNPAASGRIFGDEGNDAIFGGRLADTLYGGDGNDVIAGGGAYLPDKPGGALGPFGISGRDHLYGGAGIDALYGFDGPDVIRGGDGSDQSTRSIAVPTYDNWTDGSKLTVQAGLYGGTGNDELYGEAGKDHLYGGLGSDRLWGGSGADIFVFEWSQESRPDSRRDVIMDFSEEDRIDLYWMDANTTRSGNQAFGFIGGEPFHKRAGELHFVNKTLSGDTNGDGKADFEIRVPRVDHLDVGDLFL